MGDAPLPLLPGVDPGAAPGPDDPDYGAWLADLVFSAEGVDRSLIWASLHQSPTERLRSLQQYLDTFRASEDVQHPIR